ncbi:hypothetical protein ACIQXD_05265 [Streptomyces uncialis]|uniref:hypothetical protein n=1 Tax=Streptomyces uncialis TaxID=1048205 RepID=UPI0038002A8C
MTTSTRVRIIECTTETELCRQYSGQSQPQPAYIELDLREGTLLADYDSEVGSGVPAAVYHGFERRYSIPLLTGGAANRSMRELAQLADRILADWEETWDGSNHVAVLGEDAQAAEAEIAGHLGSDLYSEDTQGFPEEDLVAVWDVDGATTGYEAEEHGITAGTTDERLAEIAAEITLGMADCGRSPAAVVHGLDEYLHNLRAEAAEGQQKWVLVSAVPGDDVPGTEISDPDSPLDFADLPAEAQEWAAAQGYGPDSPDELLYVLDEDDTVPAGFASHTVTLPA